MTVMGQLQDIFRQVFDDDEITVSEDTTANDIEGWDSLSHVNLIVAVEARFRFRFSQAELRSLKNVGDLAAIVSARGSA